MNILILKKMKKKFANHVPEFINGVLNAKKLGMMQNAQLLLFYLMHNRNALIPI